MFSTSVCNDNRWRTHSVNRGHYVCHATRLQRLTGSAYTTLGPKTPQKQTPRRGLDHIKTLNTKADGVLLTRPQWLGFLSTVSIQHLI